MNMKCEIIRDLLPSYVDELTSNESNREIELHIEECAKCRAFLEEMRGSVDAPKVEIEDKVFVRFLKRIRKIELEKKVLVLAIVSIIGVLIYDGIRQYVYGIYDVAHDEVNIRCEVAENRRILVFEPKDDEWVISVGYHSYGDSDEIMKVNGEEPERLLGLTKSRKAQGVEINKYTIEFLDGDTYRAGLVYEETKFKDTEYIDFEKDDFIQIDFVGEKRTIRLIDIYEGNIESLK